jgi:hypothetical protein
LSVLIKRAKEGQPGQELIDDPSGRSRIGVALSGKYLDVVDPTLVERVYAGAGIEVPSTV